MRLITVAGPPSSGKTAVIVKTTAFLLQKGLKVGVVKFDCLATSDDGVYRQLGLPVKIGISGNLCPDHFFVSNIDDCVRWGTRLKLDLLISESAGLCNRCSPHIKGVLAVCVIDNLAGIHTPRKIGPMLKLADLVVITKGDIVSQAEREVFAFKVQQANPRAKVVQVNGITGQGALDLSIKWQQAMDTVSLEGRRLRFAMPAAICPYCVGETRIGEDHQRGNVKKMTFEDVN
jgi:Ni2+-binding GTPase involved in maturation of urease and hydrogenase